MLELFSGKQPLSNEFMRLGHEAVTVDDGSIDGLDVEDAGTDIVADILDLSPGDLGDGFDVVWASPPCHHFSMANNRWGYWDNDQRLPAKEEVLTSVRLAYKALYIIESVDPDWWFLENPQGRMRWVLPMEPSGIVNYCAYGGEYKKRTHLFGRHPPVFEYRRCPGREKCGHVKNGQQENVRDPSERSKLPDGLVEAVVDACERPYDGVVRQRSVNDVLD